MMRALSVVLFLLLSTACFAQSPQGFYIAGGAMSQQLKARTASNEVFDGLQVTAASSSSQDDVGGTLLIGYQLPLGASGTAMLELGSDWIARSTFPTHGASSPGNSLDIQWRVSHDWFLAIKPGIRFGPGLLAYVSLAYHAGQVDMAGSARFNCTSSTSCDQISTRSGSGNVSGTGFGLGLQGAVSERLFIRGEVENIRFSRAVFDNTPAGSTGADFVSVHGIKPEAMVGRIIVGYRF